MAAWRAAQRAAGLRELGHKLALCAGKGLLALGSMRRSRRAGLAVWPVPGLSGALLVAVLGVWQGRTQASLEARRGRLHGGVAVAAREWDAGWSGLRKWLHCARHTASESGRQQERQQAAAALEEGATRIASLETALAAATCTAEEWQQQAGAWQEEVQAALRAWLTLNLTLSPTLSLSLHHNVTRPHLQPQVIAARQRAASAQKEDFESAAEEALSAKEEALSAAQRMEEQAG